jgi:hypothetical protein
LTLPLVPPLLLPSEWYPPAPSELLLLRRERDPEPTPSTRNLPVEESLLAILDAHDSLMEGDSDGTCCMLSTMILRVVLLSLIMYCPPKNIFLCEVTVRINRFPLRQRVLKQRDTLPVFYKNQRWTVSTIIRFNRGGGSGAMILRTGVKW